MSFAHISLFAVCMISFTVSAQIEPTPPVLGGPANAADADPYSRSTDSKIILGIIKSDTQVAESVSDFSCSSYPRRKVAEGKIVSIGGTYLCREKYGNSTEKFVEIFINGKKYYIHEQNITLQDDDRERLEQATEAGRQALADSAMTTSKMLRANELKPILAEVEATRKAGLMILNRSISDVSEYTEGTSFEIQVLNPTEKIIKYIWFTVTGYNAVNDPVRDRLKGGPALTVKAIGPIEKNDTGSYEWKYMWHTDVVQRFKINEIKIEYMDKSVKTIRNTDAITMTENSFRTLNDDE